MWKAVNLGMWESGNHTYCDFQTSQFPNYPIFYAMSRRPNRTVKPAASAIRPSRPISGRLLAVFGSDPDVPTVRG
jgi:hypothetical protein